MSIVIRLAKPADWPLIQQFHQEQNLLGLFS